MVRPHDFEAANAQGTIQADRRARLLLGLALVPMVAVGAAQLGVLLAAVAIMLGLVILGAMLIPVVLRSRRRASMNRFEPGLFDADAGAPAHDLLRISVFPMPTDPRSFAARVVKSGMVFGRLRITADTVSFLPYDEAACFEVSVDREMIRSLDVDGVGTGRAVFEMKLVGRPGLRVQTVNPDALKATLAI